MDNPQVHERPRPSTTRVVHNSAACITSCVLRHEHIHISVTYNTSTQPTTIHDIGFLKDNMLHNRAPITGTPMPRLASSPWERAADHPIPP
jgi:hypothetical protein